MTRTNGRPLPPCARQTNCQPFNEVRAIIIRELAKRGRMNRNDMRSVARYGDWTDFCRRLQREGLVKPEKNTDLGDKIVHYAATNKLFREADGKK